jgi:hypothetical protein
LLTSCCGRGRSFAASRAAVLDCCCPYAEEEEEERTSGEKVVAVLLIGEGLRGAGGIGAIN